MKALGALLTALMVPLMLLNLLGGIVSLIWLAFLGQWSTIFLGLLIGFTGAFLVSVLLLPGIGLAGLGSVAFERGNKAIGGLLVLLSAPWTPLVILVWEVAIFLVFGRRAPAPNLALPVWLWSYSAATGVWSYLASKEQQTGNGDMAAFGAFAAQIAYLVLSVCILWLQWPLGPSVLAMAVPLALPLAVGLMLVAATLRHAYRNQLLATLAGPSALAYGCAELLFGTVVGDASHADGTPEFYTRLSALMQLQEGGIRVRAPAAELSTAELIRKSGVPREVLSWAHSCHVSSLACGHCRGCIKHYEVTGELYGEPF
jgi:hypothetical protein